jgi:hypothetical protein
VIWYGCRKTAEKTSSLLFPPTSASEDYDNLINWLTRFRMNRDQYLENHDFKTLGLGEGALSALTSLHKFNLQAIHAFNRAIRFPEPGYKLELSERAGSELRQFKHLHQVCSLHAEHYGLANQIRTTYLVDSYLCAVTRLNPMGIYSAARGILELHAVARYVQFHLEESIKGPFGEWRERGIRYFDVIMRARFGTSDPNKAAHLKSHGMDDKYLKPFRIRAAREFLGKKCAWVNEHYESLCDFVHPNLSSQTSAGAYAGEANVVAQSSGSVLLMNNSVPIIHYEFPMPEGGKAAALLTAERALESVLGTAKASDFPHSPFTEEELLKMTGSRLGMEVVSKQTRGDGRLRKVGRNEACPCGSGKKYKKCCGA